MCYPNTRKTGRVATGLTTAYRVRAPVRTWGSTCLSSQHLGVKAEGSGSVLSYKLSSGTSLG